MLDDVHTQRLLESEPAPEAPDGLDSSVAQALGELRRASGLDVAFISRFAQGQRIILMVDQAPGVSMLQAGTSEPIERSWCQRVATGALPQMMVDAASFIARGDAPQVDIPIGTHISVPVMLANGDVFGTLCAFSASVNPRAGALDLRRMQGAAMLLARRIARARGSS